MNIKIICVGKIKEKYYRDMVDDYVAKIRKKHNIVIIQNEDERIPQKTSDAVNKRIIDIESERSMQNIGKNDYIVALCINGKQCNTGEFQGIIDNAMDGGFTCITFIIGGSLGMSDELVSKAHYKLSFSAMTFPHQLMRVMLLDRINEIYL